MTTTPIEPLLPCPFCGSANVDPKGWASQNSSGPACDDCGASAGSTLADTPEANIAAWQRRTTPASQHSELADDNEIIERAVRATYDDWPSTAATPALAEMFGVELGTPLTIEQLEANGGDIKGLRRMVTAAAKSVLAALRQPPSDAIRLAIDLAEAEAAYRHNHDHFGGCDMKTARAWDLMRRAGDKVRALTQGKPDHD